MMGGGSGSPGAAGPPSGNRAFDEYRMETLRRLEEEQREFRDFLERLRFAKDKTEFDQFMAERRDPAEARRRARRRRIDFCPALHPPRVIRPSAFFEAGGRCRFGSWSGIRGRRRQRPGPGLPDS